MGTMTLLEMTQNVLSSLDSDDVNSISDTVESSKVATIIRNKYFDIVARGLVPENCQFFQLTPSGDSALPTLMYVPDGVSEITWMKYFDSNPADSQQQDQFGAFSHGLNTDLVSSTTFSTTSTTSNSIGLGAKTFTVDSGDGMNAGAGIQISSGTNFMFGTITSIISTTLIVNITSTIGTGTYTDWTLTNNVESAVAGYKYVTLLPIDQFLDYINRLNPGEDNVGSYTFTEGGYNFTFYYRNNHQPKYGTVLANHYVIFDSYDNLFDTTLQGSKTLCYGEFIPTFTIADSFVPNLDEQWFPLLLNEAKAMAWVELKQTPHPKADQELKRQWSVVQKKGFAAKRPSDYDAFPNYGRVPRTGGYSSGGYAAYKWMRQATP